jgi:hypothetical protein
MVGYKLILLVTLCLANRWVAVYNSLIGAVKAPTSVRVLIQGAVHE